MKHVRIAGSAFKCLALAGLLIACNNDQVVAPTEPTSAAVGDQNAKLNPLTRLVDDSGQSIEYKKSGKFFGKISRVGKSPLNDEYVTYTYSENPAGYLSISKKTYKASNNSFIREHKFKVVNGQCTQSENDNGDIFEYKYNSEGYLSEVNQFIQGILTESWKYKYDWTYRLNVIEHQKEGKPYHTYHFKSYTSIENKYPLNIEIGIRDRYLPIFGKCSKFQVEEIMDYNLLTNNHVQTFYTKQKLNGDGLVIFRYMVKYATVYKETFNYSVNWQGLPGNP
ncbi:hypothetical protein [Dyadobacter fermentans]|uniref:YD repeat protein n=1 Tax=Dyadobacter fermentans (strain ATCC 700827 / DSM 18053 / CIP 107007 / KCTC 52180 / NS114) TaxID=471854 RepID=C6W303_DYAFD|nr:hypothetical protein [Dyadobacter fermentans]ACT95716.1 hypothetical protein Dfer_4515 [Dyadobacter fermentans DSM 18053]